jgi:hypothetical protein
MLLILLVHFYYEKANIKIRIKSRCPQAREANGVLL